MRDLHMVPVDVTCMMARKDFSLAAPPRELAELFELVNRLVSLKMQANKWSVEASPDMDNDCQNYISALARNIENGRRRYMRQWFKFRVQEDELLLDDSGRPLRCPDSDQVLPPIPVGLATHRPCLCLPAPCAASTPK